MTATATDGITTWQQVTTFRVIGMPRPGGSKKAFVNKFTGRAQVVEDCKASKDWRGDVKNAALLAWGDQELLDEPMRLTVTFLLPRPKGHFGTGRNAGTLKPAAALFPATKPDTTKLVRSTEDALTGVIWKDDSRIVDQTARKVYGARPGAVITVETLTD